MKNVLKKLSTVFVALSLSLSLVSCGSSDEKEKSKGGGRNCSSPEEAMHSLITAFYDADIDRICNTAAPSEVWDYVCKETGLSKEKVLNRILKSDTVEDYSEVLKKSLKKSDIQDVKIKEKWEGGDSWYHDFGDIMSKAGIEENVECIYIIEEVTNEFDMPNLWEGWAYEVNGNWYFGEEYILDDLFYVVRDGYDALPEERDDEDDYDEYDYNEDTYDEDDYYEEDYDDDDLDTEPDAVNLCADSSNWTSYFNEENDCASTLKILSDGAALEVTKNSEGYYYYNQLGYNNLALEKNATYRLEFDYEATEDLSIEFRIQQNYEPYSWYDGEIFDAPASRKHYSMQFTMPVNDNNVSIVFNCNNLGVTLPYTFTVKNLTLVRVD